MAAILPGGFSVSIIPGKEPAHQQKPPSQGEKFPVEIAAKVNAMLAHTLELDDVHPASKTHGSASIIPAAWALAESLQRTRKPAKGKGLSDRYRRNTRALAL